MEMDAHPIARSATQGGAGGVPETGRLVSIYMSINIVTYLPSFTYHSKPSIPFQVAITIPD